MCIVCSSLSFSVFSCVTDTCFCVYFNKTWSMLCKYGIMEIILVNKKRSNRICCLFLYEIIEGFSASVVYIGIVVAAAVCRQTLIY